MVSESQHVTSCYVIMVVLDILGNLLLFKLLSPVLVFKQKVPRKVIIQTSLYFECPPLYKNCILYCPTVQNLGICASGVMVSFREKISCSLLHGWRRLPIGL